MMQTCHVENKRGNQEWIIRDYGNIGHTRHRTKTNKTEKQNISQKTKKMSNTDTTKN